MSTRRLQELLDESQAKDDQIQAKDYQIQAKDNQIQAKNEQLQADNKLTLRLQKDVQIKNDEVLIRERENEKLQVICVGFLMREDDL